MITLYDKKHENNLRKGNGGSFGLGKKSYGPETDIETRSWFVTDTETRFWSYTNAWAFKFQYVF